MIRSFEVLNREAKGMAKGMAHPGFFYVDVRGVIREKFFERNELDRFTPNNVIEKLFPELAEKVGITMSNISVLKNGKAKAIRLSTLEAICKALKCQPGDLLEYSPDFTRASGVRSLPAPIA